MEAAAPPLETLGDLGAEVRDRGSYRNLRVNLLHREGDEPLVMVSNKTAAAAYRLGPGWLEKFQENLQRGYFG